MPASTCATWADSRAATAILLHCAAGRDRTGVVVALLLASLGVHDEDIVADYVLSDDALADEYARFKDANPGRAADVDEGIAKRAWVMRRTLATLREVFGGALDYLAQAGVRSADLAAIRAKLAT